MRMHIKTFAPGHGVAEGIRPNMFEVGDDGSVHRVTKDCTESDRLDLEDAVYQCPTRSLAP